MQYPHLSQRTADSPDRRGQPFLPSPDVDSPQSMFMHVFDPIPVPTRNRTGGAQSTSTVGDSETTVSSSVSNSNRLDRVNPARSSVDPPSRQSARSSCSSPNPTLPLAAEAARQLRFRRPTAEKGVAGERILLLLLLLLLLV
ncbi:hypothetical protein CRG98_038481 [Punica granatum]|uniref:Uncharacterized protein n=1 Tax=Punica granatum TaxID=22663 RepID=A0A2I0IB01_PUNGR|nr:hypothetical protein CRG98_038481 [Punica granatum]